MGKFKLPLTLDWWADHIKGRDRDIARHAVGKEESIRKILDAMR